ncbi:LuxR C-terminal-related transcriptional regulator [Microbacterium sp. SS28]|uniref:helix-turn-helix transcriptional regulator n=1 Tax=Microbacterium sp. SS28 TaxID=2919948 RepID=UPI001FA984D6|nr:LuxR C-terminal-related transcriptional regulator [Microbacterium sp. SS28]
MSLDHPADVRAARGMLTTRHDDLLRDLVLFGGPFELAAATALCGRSADEVAGDLARLVAAGLIERLGAEPDSTEPSRDPALAVAVFESTVAYRMPPLTREAVLADAGEHGPLAPALVAYLHAIARSAASRPEEPRIIRYPSTVGQSTAPLEAPRPAITPRERDVLLHLATGRTNKEIAVALGVSVKTVMHHSMAIYRKLGVRGRSEATAFVYRTGLLGGRVEAP